jgi:hypothetical protein
MNGRKSKFIVNCVLLVLLGATSLRAMDNCTLKSAYLGDGLFQYEMTVHNDPFFVEEKNNFALFSFSNLVEAVSYTPDWQFLDFTNSFALEYPSGDPDIERPYKASCIVRSACTNYRMSATMDDCAIIHGSIIWLDDRFGSPYLSGNAVFYSRLEALIPCPPEEADGSPAVCERSFEMIGDVEIDQVVMVEGVAQGLSFSWVTNCTVLVQASSNMTDWVDVQYALGSSTPTNWIAEEPLANYGAYYRVLLVAKGHHPELLEPDASHRTAITRTVAAYQPSFRIVGISGGVMTLEVDTITDAAYAVSFYSMETHEVARTVRFVAEGSTSTVTVNVSDLPSAMTIDVTETK